MKKKILINLKLIKFIFRFKNSINNLLESMTAWPTSPKLARGETSKLKNFSDGAKILK